MMKGTTLRIALIGYGYWGVNIARTIMSISSMKLISISDISSDRRTVAQNDFPNLKIFDIYTEQIEGTTLDAAIVATPVSTHFEIVKNCLECGLHVLSEKVLSENREEIIHLKAIADVKDRVIDVGLTYLHNAIIKYINQELCRNFLGDVLYVTLKRTGLGPIRKDVDVIADLAAHDISILLKWFGRPDWVTANGVKYNHEDMLDVCFIQLGFGNMIASIHCSWMTPIKQRTIEIIGTEGMIVFDDLGLEKLKIIKPQTEYYKSVSDFGSAQLKISSGDIIIPNIDYSQPLLNELVAFYDLIVSRKKSSMPNISISIAEILNAARESVNKGSTRIMLQ